VINALLMLHIGYIELQGKNVYIINILHKASVMVGYGVWYYGLQPAMIASRIVVCYYLSIILLLTAIAENRIREMTDL